MITLIHGGHRHGTHWEVLKLLKTQLELLGEDIHIIDLSDLAFNACCGDQICQQEQCIYKGDQLYKELFDFVLPSDVIYIITPTYFNMPPAKLKSFIDRTNALLPIIEERDKHVVFGAWVSGEADVESVTTNFSLLKEYATIMGWTPCDDICNCTVITDEYTVQANQIVDVANKIKSLA